MWNTAAPRIGHDGPLTVVLEDSIPDSQEVVFKKATGSAVQQPAQPDNYASASTPTTNRTQDLEASHSLLPETT